MNDALLQVLSKASAVAPETIAGNPALQDALAAGGRYAQQFLYKTQRDQQADGSFSSQLYLHAVFPEKIVLSLLKQGGLPFWPARQRQPVLMLPVVHSRGLESMAAYRAPGLVDLLQQAADVHGIPLVEGDGQEDAEQLWRANPVYLQQLLDFAKKRFAVVIQAEGENGNAARGHWVLFDKSQSISTMIYGRDQAAFAEKGMAWLASQLASKSAVALTVDSTTFDVAISGVYGYSTYNKVLHYFKSFSIVKHVGVNRFFKDTLYLTVLLDTNVDQLEKLILSGKTLLPVTNILTKEDMSVEMPIMPGANMPQVDFNAQQPGEEDMQDKPVTDTGSASVWDSYKHYQWNGEKHGSE